MFVLLFITPTFLGQASYTYLNCPMPYLPINPATGKMILPSTAKRIKMDIGLSHNAPNSEVWLKQWVIPLLTILQMICLHFSRVSLSNTQTLPQVS